MQVDRDRSKLVAPKAVEVLPEEDDLLAEEKRKLQERVRSYARNVKEMYWPKVSEEKRQEMTHLKDPNLRQSVLRIAANRNHINNPLPSSRIN